MRGVTHGVRRGDVYFKDARAIQLKERSREVGLLSTERRAKRKGKPAQTELDF